MGWIFKNSDDDVNKLNIYYYLPKLSFVSILFLLIVVIFYFLYPLYISKSNAPVSEFSAAIMNSWSSGEISSHHNMISHNCSACHDGNFTKVNDKKCTSCHEMSEHASFYTNQNHLSITCASCHMEHNAEKLTVTDSRLCVSCHENILTINKDTDFLNVNSLENHPEFRIDLFKNKYTDEKERISLSEKDKYKDLSNIKLNHALHLKPLRTKNETVELSCRSCHEASRDLKNIQSINFEKHCKDCHSLEFDDRLKGVEVPHAEPDVVYDFLYAEYAKLVLESDSLDNNDYKKLDDLDTARSIPGRGASSIANSVNINDDFKKANVLAESREAEERLFTKTACYLCHSVSSIEVPNSEFNMLRKSRFNVLNSRIPNKWYKKADFNHQSHEEIKCEDCHTDTRQSEITEDILLPGVKDCKICHVDRGHSSTFTTGIIRTEIKDKDENSLDYVTSGVQSDCITCHSFHDKKVLPDNSKRDFKDFISSFH